MDAVLHIAEQKTRITDKGRTGINLPRSINMNSGSVHRMAVRESVIRSMHKTRRLLCLCDADMTPCQSLKLPAKSKDLRHRLRYILRPRRGNSYAAPLWAQEIKAYAAHIAEIVCHLYDAVKRPDIIRCDNTGQTDLNAVLREALNPDGHIC